MANILILGGGFGGLIAAEELSQTLGADHQITLVSPDDEFVFYPALVHLAFGECTPSDITFDLAERLRELDVRFVKGEVIKIKTDKKYVQVTGRDFAGEIFYDYLIIAMGRRLATEKVPGFFEYAHHLLNVDAARRFGEAIRNFKKGTIVVGMAPRAFLPVPVCETASALAGKFKSEIESGKISVNVVFPETVKEAFGGADLTDELTEAFKKHNISLTTDFPVKEISQNEMQTRDGRKSRFDLLMLLPPFRGQSFLDGAGLFGDLDFLITDQLMRVPQVEGVYAIGDIVDFPGPKLAYMAIRQAKVAAANIVSEIGGKEPSEYYYHEMAMIIDAGGADSIYMHFGIWDEQEYRLKKGAFWSHVKRIHDRIWRTAHKA